MPPLVSILIPAYNAEATVAETIRSALAQTWPQKEIIIVDDGSRDQTLSVARRFAGERVSVVTQSNQGAAAARNKAYSLSHGDYIQWLDADDLLAPDKIARQMQLVQSGVGPQTLLSAAWGSFCYRVHKARFVPTLLWADLSPVQWMIHKFEHGIYMQTATWLTSRELSEAAGPWDTRLLGDDDGEYFCRVLLHSDGVRFVPEAKILYRMPGAATLSYIGQSNRKMEAHFLSMKLHIDRLRAVEDSERVRAACVRYLQCWLGFFDSNRSDIIRQVEQVAAACGGHLVPPRMPWKYQMLGTVFGGSIARKIQLGYNRWKSNMVRGWDKSLFQLENAWRPRSQSPRESSSVGLHP